MTTFSRRIFLRNGSLALVSLGFAPSFLTRTVTASASARRKLLIAIFQRGAMDGLNAVVPFGDKTYYQARPSIAIARPGSGADAAIDLDGFFGLHPRLSPLKRFYEARQVAWHRHAQAAARLGVKSTRDGWLNRYLQARGVESAQETAFRAVALAPQLPRALQGPAPALAMNRIAQFGVRGDAPMGTSFEAQYKAAADVVLNGAGRDAFEAIRALKAADPERYQPERGADYPRSAFGQALRQIAQLAKADVGLEVAFAESNGWDHHVNEGAATGQLAARLDDFARGLAALATDLGDRLDDTIILTMSEFGRAVAENGNRGTDHGHGNAMMVLGGAVRGGRIYGRWPGLARDQRFEGRDLAITTDFRDVFGEIVVRHLGSADPGAIFPGYEINPSRFAGFLK
jgi:uncharacterized protein (DUF1501 family)